MRAPGAEVGHAVRALDLDDIRVAAQQPVGALREVEPDELAVEPARDDAGQHQRRQFADPGNEAFAFLVLLAHHSLGFPAGVVVEVFLELALDDAALFLDDEHLVFALHELECTVRLERPDHADLVDVEPDALCLLPVDAEQAQCLHEVEVCLARRDDAEARFRYVEDLAVDRVGGRERERRGFLGLEAFLDLRPGQVRPAIVQAARRHREVGHRELGIGRQLDGHRRLHRFRDGLEADPHSRAARQRDAVQAELEKLGDVGRVQPRHHERQECDVGLVRHGRRHAAVVVTGNDEHAAVRRAAVGVTVLERIARAVDTRPLAVPHREHAIDSLLRIGLDLLRTEHGGGREVLVDGGQELDVVLVEKRFGAPEFLVDCAERRPPVPRYESGGVQSRRPVQRALHERDADQRLGACQEHAPGLAPVAIDELVVVEGIAGNAGCGGGHG